MSKRIKFDHLGGLTLSPEHAMFVVEYSKDMNARRAAKSSGFAADTGIALRERDDVKAALAHIILERQKDANIDAEWVMYEAVDNHTIARQSGNINASNTALNLIAKLAVVDAFAAEKVIVAGDKEIVERLMRARSRNKQDDEPSFL